MDAVVNILPSPDMREDLNIYNFFENNLCAQAFKVVHNKQKGPITFFRLYSGNMLKVTNLMIQFGSSTIYISLFYFLFLFKEPKIICYK